MADETVSTVLTRAEARVLDSLSGEIEPVRRSIAYRLMLVIVALVMVVLPLIYLGLVVGIGYLLYYHAVHHVPTLRGTGAATRFRVLAYLAPLVIGAAVLVFMLKPMLARRTREHNGLRLRREDQPLLFAYVDRLAEIVGAPKPKEISVDTAVNASASFRNGWWSLLLGDLRLTIGLPLVAGMSLRELTGVIAHELGHFTQGAAMRAEFVVRSVNIWFARVVYERDSWDESLDEMCESETGWISLLGWLSTLGVWLSRRVLWALMWVGHLVSCLMSRRMEFDADRYEARVAGSPAFAGTVRKLHTLGWAQAQTFGELRQALGASRLPDDLPLAVHGIAARSPESLREAIEHSIEQGRTSWFSTHPCDRDRIANAEREQSEGIVAVEAPAQTLFRQFTEVCKTLTLVFYRDAIGAGVTHKDLAPVVTLSAEADQAAIERRAGQRYLGFAWPVEIPLRIDALTLTQPERPKQTLAQLRAAVEEYATLAAGMDDVVRRRRAAEADVNFCECVAALKKVGIGLDRDAERRLAALGATVEQGLAQSKRRLSDAAGKLQDLLDGLQPRVQLALQLLAVPDVVRRIHDGHALAADVRRFLDVLSPIRLALSDTQSVVAAQYVLPRLVSARVAKENEVLAHSLVNTRVERLAQFLSEARDILKNVPFPFPHGAGPVSIARYLANELPAEDDGAAVFRTSLDFIEKLRDLHRRCVWRILTAAAAVERLAKIPQPGDLLRGKTDEVAEAVAEEGA